MAVVLPLEVVLVMLLINTVAEDNDPVSINPVGSDADMVKLDKAVGVLPDNVLEEVVDLMGAGIVVVAAGLVVEVRGGDGESEKVTTDGEVPVVRGAVDVADDDVCNDDDDGSDGTWV